MKIIFRWFMRILILIVLILTVLILFDGCNYNKIPATVEILTYTEDELEELKNIIIDKETLIKNWNQPTLKIGNILLWKLTSETETKFVVVELSAEEKINKISVSKEIYITIILNNNIENYNNKTVEYIIKNIYTENNNIIVLSEKDFNK